MPGHRGVQQDMGEGRVVYLLTEADRGRPPQVKTLGPASLTDVGTVAEQDEQHLPDPCDGIQLRL